MTATAKADAKVAEFEQEVALRPAESAIARLPWQGTSVKSVELSVRAGATTVAAAIALDSLDASPLLELPAPPSQLAEFPAATQFFPCGEYYRGCVGDAAGSVLSHVRRQLRAYRRSYMNTYMAGEAGLLAQFRAAMTDESVPYRGPAIKVGVLRQREGRGWFAVAVNQDLQRAQSGTLSVSREVAQAGSALYDLHDLAVVGPADSVRHTIELGPGDGRIFFVGPERDASTVLKRIHEGHYQNELALYELDAEVAGANGGDAARAGVLAVAAAEAAIAGEFATAHEKIAAARAELHRAIAASPALSQAMTELSEAQAMLSDVALTYRRNFDVVMPPDLRRQIPKDAIWNNSRDPKLQAYVDQTAQALCLGMKLEDLIGEGKSAQALPQTAQLKQAAARLQAEAIPYVLSRGDAGKSR